MDLLAAALPHSDVGLQLSEGRGVSPPSHPEVGDARLLMEVARVIDRERGPVISHFDHLQHVGSGGGIPASRWWRQRLGHRQG